MEYKLETWMENMQEDQYRVDQHHEKNLLIDIIVLNKPKRSRFKTIMAQLPKMAHAELMKWYYKKGSCEK